MLKKLKQSISYSRKSLYSDILNFYKSQSDKSCQFTCFYDYSYFFEEDLFLEKLFNPEEEFNKNFNTNFNFKNLKIEKNFKIDLNRYHIDKCLFIYIIFSDCYYNNFVQYFCDSKNGSILNELFNNGRLFVITIDIEFSNYDKYYRKILEKFSHANEEKGEKEDKVKKLKFIHDVIKKGNRKKFTYNILKKLNIAFNSVKYEFDDDEINKKNIEIAFAEKLKDIENKKVIKL